MLLATGPCCLDRGMLGLSLIVHDLGQHHKLDLRKGLCILVIEATFVAQDNRCDAFDRFAVVLPVLFDTAEDSFG